MSCASTATRAAGMSRASGSPAASLMIEQNVSPRKLQAWLGHGSIKITMDVYGHLYPSADDDARRVIDAAFAPHVDPVLTREARQP